MAEASQTRLVSTPQVTLFGHVLSDVMGECRLYQAEFFWHDHASWLKEQGYLLRPRYQAGWSASWKGTDKYWAECEDGQTPIAFHIMDATRISDGATVALKKINLSKYPTEIEIGRLFSSAPLSSDPRNHCVPIYTVLTIPGDEENALIVMPHLISPYRLEFSTIGEAVDFITQIFEGLQFMHNQRIAHRDCKRNNIMMDPKNLYREPIHPIEPAMTCDFARRSRPLTRTERPVNYYLIDFGLSRHYNFDQDPLDEPFIGGDQTVPEYKSGALINPFMVDVYCIGNVVRNLIQGNRSLPARQGLEFMDALVNSMVQDDPRKRPTMGEVVEQFSKICSQLGSWKLRSRFAERNESLIARLFRSTFHWTKQFIFMVKRTPPIPIPPPRPT